MTKPITPQASSKTIHAVQGYAKSSRRMTLEEHVDASANIVANIAKSIYAARVQHFPPDSALELSNSLIDNIAKAAKGILAEEAAAHVQQLNDDAQRVIEKVNEGEPMSAPNVVSLKRDAAEKMARAVMNKRRT